MSRDELDALGCRLGWSYMCPVVGCDEEVEVDSCDDYQAIEDCRACQYYPCQEGETGHACGENGYFKDTVRSTAPDLPKRLIPI